MHKSISSKNWTLSCTAHQSQRQLSWCTAPATGNPRRSLVFSTHYTWTAPAAASIARYVPLNPTDTPLSTCQTACNSWLMQAPPPRSALGDSNVSLSVAICAVSEWVSSVLRPDQHSIGYTGDGFYRSKDPTNSIKVLKMLQRRKKTTKTTKYTYSQTIMMHKMIYTK